MTKAQRADRLLRDSACWQEPFPVASDEQDRNEDMQELCDMLWEENPPLAQGTWPEDCSLASSLALGRVAALGFDLENTEKVAYLTAAGWAAWPPLPPAPPPTLTAAEKRAKAEGKEPTRGQRDRWDTQRGPWPRETTKARGR